MGVCGCGDFQPSFKFKGPGDNWYVLQEYPGCSYCDTPAGVMIHQMNPEDAAMWGVEHIKEQAISPDGFLVAIIHKEKLKEKLTKYLRDMADGMADDFMSEHFRNAVHESFDA